MGWDWDVSGFFFLVKKLRKMVIKFNFLYFLRAQSVH